MRLITPSRIRGRRISDRGVVANLGRCGVVQYRVHWRYLGREGVEWFSIGFTGGISAGKVWSGSV
jgi:hypothetical protein